MSLVRTPEQRRRLFDEVSRFFDTPEHFKTLSDIVGGRHRGGLTLRLLDYLYTRYAHHGGASFVHNGDVVCVEELYYGNLERYGKAYYDCFRRSARILFTRDGKDVLTTLAQLVFFMHLIRDGVLQYAELHRDAIYACMQADDKPKTAADAPKSAQQRRRKRMHMHVHTRA